MLSDSLLSFVPRIHWRPANISALSMHPPSANLGFWQDSGTATFLKMMPSAQKVRSRFGRAGVQFQREHALHPDPRSPDGHDLPGELVLLRGGRLYALPDRLHVSRRPGHHVYMVRADFAILGKQRLRG